MPRISVVIPAYNRARYLDTAAATVLAQTWSDLELIIIDDGSQDNTPDVCGRLCEYDSRVRYIRHENKGLPAARNTGIRAATGEFIALLDSDDFWAPTKLAKQLDLFARDQTLGVVYCDWASIDQSGHVSQGVNPPDFSLPSLYEALLFDNVVHGSASAVLIRATCFDQVGLFDESLRANEDWDMWLRTAEHYQFAKVPEVLVYLLQHSDQMQRAPLRMADSMMRRLRN